MDINALSNLIAWIDTVPMDDDTRLEVRGAVFMAAAGFQADGATKASL